MVRTTATAVKRDLKDALFPVNIDLTFPLLHVVESDDVVLEQNSNAEWFRLLRRLRWREYRDLAAAYYASLADFNEQALQQRQGREAEPSAEGKEGARLRLLFDRPTMQAESRQVGTMLFEPPAPPERSTIDPETLAPGVVPLRYAVQPSRVARQPKDFFSLFKAFTGVVMMGRPPEPEEVHHHLVNNPSFARACGFTQPKPNGLYRSSDIPSLRKLEQFDQIMTTCGLWDRCKWDEVKKSLAQEAIQPERELVHDTTHFPAASRYIGTSRERCIASPNPKSPSLVGVKTKSNAPIPFNYATTAQARWSKEPVKCIGRTKPPSSPSPGRESPWTWSP